MRLRPNPIPGPEFRIDLRAVEANYRLLKSLVGAETEIAAVVKSDAYGLGAGAIVPTLVEAGCRRFFVADLREAVHVRRALASAAHIYILSGVHSDELDACLGHRLTPVCHSLPDAVEAARRLPEFVLNIDTGFSRFGLTVTDVQAFVHISRRVPDLALSHLACADVPSDPTNCLQRDRFVAACEILRPVRRSLGASAAIWLAQRFHFDVMRVGSALYGLNNAGITPTPLLPVVQLFGRLAEIRTVRMGETVGYAASFRAKKSMRIGIVALGYAAGLPWSAGNAINGAIEHHPTPVVGRVAMEYVAVDLDNVPAALCVPGQAVEFLGPSRSAEALAEAAGTIPQELLTRLGSSCPRNYASLDHSVARKDGK
jgi:alanine racemase